MAEVIETHDIDDWEILSDDGWHDLTHIHKTIPYDVWSLKTDTHELMCADEHIVIRYDGSEVYVMDLCVGDKLKTDNGIECVVEVKKLDMPQESMYDFSVDSEDHTLFTNGILSHNSTMSSVYLLHYMLFNKDKVVAILANKETAAQEVLRRVKGAYSMLPLWMQQGIRKWNEGSIELENGMRMIANTTSSDSISGETVSLLYLDEFAKVKPHIAEEFVTSTLPVVSSGKTSKVIIVSTPLGMNQFYSYWRGANETDPKLANNFYPIKVNWWDHPDRDEAWKIEQLKTFNNDLAKFNQEYNCLKSETYINIKDTETGEILNMPISEVYNLL